MLIAVVGSAAAFIAASSLLLWVAGLRGASAEARLATLAQPARPTPLDAPFSERVMIPVLGALARLVIELLPQTFVKRVTRQLVSAGQPMTTQAFFVTVVIMGVMFPASALAFFLLAIDGGVPLLAAVLVLVFASAGILAPFLWLRRRLRARKLAIWKSLPDAFDLITVSIEAGLGLDAAMRQVSERLRGPLAEEIGQTLREVGMGRPRREALEEMAERADVKELATFVNAVIQAEQLGTSLGRVLRAQGVTLRIHRRQRAEELSRKAPVKMVFPLVLFIMPTFFIVTLGPILIRLVDHLTE